MDTLPRGPPSPPCRWESWLFAHLLQHLLPAGQLALTQKPDFISASWLSPPSLHLGFPKAHLTLNPMAPCPFLHLQRSETHLRKTADHQHRLTSLCQFQLLGRWIAGISPMSAGITSSGHHPLSPPGSLHSVPNHIPPVLPLQPR